MLIDNNYNSGIYTQTLNKNLDLKKSENAAEIENKDITNAVTNSGNAILNQSDFYKNKTFNTEDDSVNNAFKNLKDIMKDGKPSMADINDFLNTTQAQLKSNNTKVTSSLSMNAFKELNDTASNIKSAITNNQTDKFNDLTSDIYKKHETYMNSVMSTHNIMDSIIKQRG